MNRTQPQILPDDAEQVPVFFFDDDDVNEGVTQRYYSMPDCSDEQMASFLITLNGQCATNPFGGADYYIGDCIGDTITLTGACSECMGDGPCIGGDVVDNIKLGVCTKQPGGGGYIRLTGSCLDVTAAEPAPVPANVNTPSTTNMTFAATSTPSSNPTQQPTDFPTLSPTISDVTYRMSILGLSGTVVDDSREDEFHPNYPHVQVDFKGSVGKLWLDPKTEIVQGQNFNYLNDFLSLTVTFISFGRHGFRCMAM